MGTLRFIWRWLRRLVIAVAGGVVLFIGIAMIVLPGPAFIVIPLGLGILALEFELARRWLKRARSHADAVRDRVLPTDSPWRRRWTAWRLRWQAWRARVSRRGSGRRSTRGRD